MFHTVFDFDTCSLECAEKSFVTGNHMLGDIFVVLNSVKKSKLNFLLPKYFYHWSTLSEPLWYQSSSCLR
jgi:hypothetical protein